MGGGSKLEGELKARCKMLPMGWGEKVDKIMSKNGTESRKDCLAGSEVEE